MIPSDKQKNAEKEINIVLYHQHKIQGWNGRTRKEIFPGLGSLYMWRKILEGSHVKNKNKKNIKISRPLIRYETFCPRVTRPFLRVVGLPFFFISLRAGEYFFRVRLLYSSLLGEEFEISIKWRASTCKRQYLMRWMSRFYQFYSQPAVVRTWQDHSIFRRRRRTLFNFSSVSSQLSVDRWSTKLPLYPFVLVFLAYA